MPKVTEFPRPEDPDAELRAAIEEARKQNKPVEVEAAYTEGSRTWAYPDGHLTTQSYAGPAQLKQADGSWAWIDTTLVERDGVLKPKLARAKIEFSAGGADRPFASMERGDGQRVSFGWPTELPKPTVRENVATFVDAAGQGADLVVTALPTGFRHDVVLREKPKGPVEFRIPVETDGLDLAEAKRGGLELTDTKGRQVASAAEPVTIDAGPSAAEAKTAGALPPRTGKIDTRVVEEKGEQTLVLTPDPAFLADPATRYPVTVDPTTTLTLQSDLVVSNTGNADTSPASQRLVTSIERTNSAGTLTYSHSLLKFDTGVLAGRSVGSARLDMYADQLVGCRWYGPAGIEAKRVTSAWPQYVSWSNQPSVTSFGSSVQLCPSTSSVDDNGNWIPRTFTWSVTAMAQAWAAGQPNEGIRLSGKGTTDPAQNSGWWVYFHSAEKVGGTKPKLTVSYFLPPEIPTVNAESLDSMDGTDAIARSTSVKVGFKSSVPEGTNLDYTVSVNDSTMVPPPSFPAGHVAHWKLDESAGAASAADSGTGGFTATYAGSRRAAITGKLGGAVQLNDMTGSNGCCVPDSYAATNRSVLNQNSSFSVSAWVRLKESESVQYVASQDGDPFGLSIYYLGGSHQKWRLQVSGTGGTTGYGVWVDSAKLATADTWTHLVGIYDAGTSKIRLYVDGVLSGEADYQPSGTVTGGPFRIGGHKSGLNLLQGAVDDMRLYQRVLSLADIKKLYGEVASTSYNAKPSGQVIEQTFALHNPASLKFVVRACRSGVSQPSCNESPPYRVTSDAPMLPTDTETGMADPTRPILSGMVNRPSGGPVTAKYFLYNSTGAPVGSSPLGERTVNGGERASFQVPENTVQLGGTYTWQMQACALEICTAKTAPVSVTIPGDPPEPPAEPVNHLTLLKDNFVIKTAKVDPTACDGSPCTVTDSTVMRIGGSGTDKTAAVIGFRLDELPDGAGVSEGILKLGTPACPAGTCPADAIITATPLKSQVTGETKGSDLAGDANVDVTPYALPLSGPQANIAGSEYQWLMLTSNKDEIITFGDAVAAEQPSVALTYILAGPPSKVLNLTTQGGDASAIASWGLPESNGGIAMLDGYDVEVTEGGGAVVETLDVKDPWAAITGLANDMTYTVKVRAKTRFGVSGWEIASVTTKAVPPPPVRGGGTACVPFLDSRSPSASANSSTTSGAQAYIDRVKAYYQAQDAVLENRANTIWDAPGVTADGPSTAKLSLLNAELVQARTAMNQAGTTRSGSVVEIPGAVVRGMPDGTVHVMAEVKRSWVEQTSSPARAARPTVGTAGQIEPSEAIIDIFVFDRCGGTSIIQVPLEVEQDSTDFYYDEEWEEYLSTGLIPGETPPSATDQSQAKLDAANAASGSCDPNPEDGNSGKSGSWVKEKPGYGQYKLLDKQRHPTTRILWKGWQLHAEARSTWCHPDGEDYSSLTTETWRIPSLVNYVRVYTIGPWRLKTEKELAEYRYILNNLVIKSAGEACFNIERDDSTGGVTVAIDGNRSPSAGVYVELNGSIETTCRPYEKIGPVKPSNPNPDDFFRLKAVWTKKTSKAECFEGPTTRCELTGYQHRFEPEVTFCRHVTARVADCSEWIPSPYNSWWHDFLGRKSGNG
ncbi:LamG-like jellyroll fold domain-containing protein [Streptosporangium sp. V21-05]|uniref:LamG-like jellyroll fold domain-containing protein n=1 Tax=Streptosporangium sp. V21-05 TaxID=3446115 RepID=UPI003F5345C1